MSDADLLRLFLVREATWVATLQRLQGYHRQQLGRQVGPIHWIAGDTLGRLSWFGYFWESERFWFGYGLHGPTWSPLIEADRRIGASDAWKTLTAEVPSVWPVDESRAYLRLWGDDVAEAPDQHVDWFLARSRELHEFSIQA